MSRGRPSTKSPTSCKIRSPIRLRKQDLPQKGQGRCVKFRVRRIILAAGRSSGRVMPSVASGRYCPGADTAKPSLARCAGQGIYRICSFQSWAMSLLMLKTLFLRGFDGDAPAVVRHLELFRRNRHPYPIVIEGALPVVFFRSIRAVIDEVDDCGNKRDISRQHVDEELFRGHSVDCLLGIAAAAGAFGSLCAT